MTDKKTHSGVLPPPLPDERREPLPWQTPKSTSEDAESAHMLQAILDSDSYTPAVQDLDFLGGSSTRGLRLQLDYLKPERSLRKYGIEHTIVVFGSTRIVEPRAARRRLEKLQAQLADRPDDSELAARLVVAQRIMAKSHFYDTAREFSRLVGESGKGPGDCRLVVMTGGGPGMMEAANRGSRDVHARTVGLNIQLPHEQFPNPYISPELCFQFHYFALRKLHFMLRARALVAFPGGYGTFDELFETLTLIQTRKIKPVPVVLVGEAFWRKAFDVDFLVDEGVIDPEDRDLFWYAESAGDIWRGLQLWYERRGESLVQHEC